MSPRSSRLPSSLVAALAVLAALAGAREAGGREAVAPALRYEKYVLENGLTVILHEDRRLPLVAVNLWYRVGTREEPSGRSGFAHLFEHLMFKGTERVPEGEFDRIMETGGGWNNATTSFDRTNYFDVGPAHLLPVLLWLEADRMQALGRGITQEKLDVEREVVRNERRQSYDDAPYGESEVLLWELMYPRDHPYHFHVIGSHEDLMRATVEDVTEFFDTFYVPNNAALVVAGDFDRVQVRRWIAGFFGSLPRGRVPPRRPVPPAALGRTERVTLQDAVQLARLTMVWHSPALYAQGDAEMDLAAFALAEGTNSRLYRRLVDEERVAVAVDASQGSQGLGSLFEIQVTVAPDVPLGRVEALLDEELARLGEEGPSAEEVARGRSRFETETLASLQSLHAIADQLNHYEHFLGEPDSLAWDLSRYARATPESVRTAVREVLDPSRRLVLSVVPRTPPAEGLPSLDEAPRPTEPRPFEAPVPATFSLENGLEVWHLEIPALPLVALRVVLPAGSSRDGAGRAGLASLAARMLEEGAGARDARAFADALDALGARLDTSADRDASTVSLQVLRRNLDPAMALFADALQRPRLEAGDFERVRRVRAQELEQVVDHPGELARWASNQAYYGPTHPYGTPAAGRPDTVRALGLEDVRRFHAERHVPRGAVLLVAGDLPLAEARALAQRHMGAWKGAPPTAPAGETVPAPGRDGGLRVLLVDKPGSTQTVVRYVLPAVPYAHADRPGLEVLNTLFGGSFTSRLNQNLRERRGYTYGASSRFDHLMGAGTFAVGAAVQADKTGPALHEFQAELRAVRSGNVTAEEATKATESVRTEKVQAFATLRGVLATLAPYARAGLGPEALRRDLEAAVALGAPGLDALASAHVHPAEGVLVLVGDAGKVLPQLEGLGLDPVRLTPAEVLSGAWAK